MLKSILNAIHQWLLFKFHVHDYVERSTYNVYRNENDSPIAIVVIHECTICKNIKRFEITP